MGDKTKVTELVTALGLLGIGHPLETLPTLPGEFRNVPVEVWEEVTNSWSDPALRPLVDGAYANGRFFRDADDGLRKRPPRLVEWTGPRRSPGDEVAPVDLRIDHVYLISCKYLSKITMNASPAHLFERLLTGGHGRRGVDWYRHVAPSEWSELWNASRAHVAATHPEFGQVDDPTDLDRAGRRELASHLRDGAKAWPVDLVEPYRRLSESVAEQSALRWQQSLSEATGAAEAMLWRLLRIGSAPYFVLGNDSLATAPLRLRVASPWDWRQAFTFRSFRIEPLDGGQPMVSWTATYTSGTDEREVRGHVEIRWSHGRFSGPPEAKVYLDTPFTDVPGYFDVT